MALYPSDDLFPSDWEYPDFSTEGETAWSPGNLTAIEIAGILGHCIVVPSHNID